MELPNNGHSGDRLEWNFPTMDIVGTGLLSIVGRLSLSRRVGNEYMLQSVQEACLFYGGCLLLRVSIYPQPSTPLTTYIPHLSHSSPRTPLTHHTHIIGDLCAADCLENLSPPPVRVVDWLPWKPRNLPDEVADRL